MIIDANAHVTENGKWFDTGFDASVIRLLNEMDLAGIDRAILVPFEGFVSHRFILETFRKNPHRFIPTCSINPAAFSDRKGLINHFKKVVSEGDFRILKLHNRFHRYDPLDKKVFWLLEENERLNRPLVIYICGCLYSRNVLLSSTPPHIFHRITSTFQATRFVILHAGGTWALHVLEAVRDNPNVFLDLSNTISKYKGSGLLLDIAFLIKNFDTRLIWGSDFPEVVPAIALNDLYEIILDIPKHKVENILYNNINHLLGL